MDLYLKDKVALITGAGSGIGLNTALLLAREGVRICCADLFEERAGSAAKKVEQAGSSAVACVCDVRNYEHCVEAVSLAVKTFGQLDILVNSAGVAAGGLFLDTDPKDWSYEMDINLIGTMNCCHAAAKEMIPCNYGKIVNLASDAGRVGEKRMSVYGASKGGVIAFTKALAVEMGRFNINVNAACPGVVKSPMTSYLTDDMEKQWSKMYPLRRLGETEDVANMIVFLCSDRASWVTGQIIGIDGGFARV